MLIYHRVPAETDPLMPGEPDARVFGWQMELLARNFRVLPLGDAIEALQAGALEPLTVCITFDDGYADNATVAVPILRKLGLTATFFITTGVIDGGRMWNDSIIEAVRVAPAGTLDLRDLQLGTYHVVDAQSRCRAIDRLLELVKYRPMTERAELSAALAALVKQPLRHDLMMTAEQLRALARAGMEIGAHTVSHPLLSKLDDAQARLEVASSRAHLCDVTGAPVRVFAYPNGKPGIDYGKRDVDLVRELGFVGAVSTAWGVGTRGADRYQIPRFTPWDRTPRRFMARLVHNYTRTRPLCVH